MSGQALSQLPLFGADASGGEKKTTPRVGSVCPCCKQRVRKLNPHRMDKSKLRLLMLLEQIRRAGADWVKVGEGNWLAYQVGDSKGGLQAPYRAGQHASRLKWYGLVEHRGPRTGMYRITEQGVGFLAGVVSVPEVIYCRDGEVVERSLATVTVGEIKDVELTREYWDTYSTRQVETTSR